MYQIPLTVLSKNSKKIKIIVFDLTMTA